MRMVRWARRRRGGRRGAGRPSPPPPAATRGGYPSGVLVGVAGGVLAAGQPELPALVGLDGEHLHRRREVPHRVAGTPDRAGVRGRAVHDAPVVQRALAALELEVDGLVL